MYWERVEDKVLMEAYGMPRTTLTGWKEKQGDTNDWRAVVLDRLSLFVSMQERATEKINVRSYFSCNLYIKPSIIS